MAQQELKKRKDAFVAEFGDSGVVEIDAIDSDAERVRQATMSQGLFSQNSFVVLRDVSSNKVMQEDLPDLLESIPSETELIIYDPAIDRRTSFFKQLQKLSEMVDCKELDEREVAKWVLDTFKDVGGDIGFGEAQFLASRVQFDQWLLWHEMQKLLDVEGPLTRDIITEYVDESFNESIFNLLDDAFAKRGGRALETYRSMLANKVESHYVFSMLVWQLHIVLVSAWSAGQSPDEVAKANKLSPFVVKKSVGLVGKTSKPELKEITSLASNIDYDSKTQAGYDMDAAVDMLIAKIAA